MIKESGWVWLIAEYIEKGQRYPYLGPFLAGFYAMLMLFLSNDEFQITLSPMFLLIILSVNWGGFRAGLISLILSVTTAAILFFPESTERFLVVVFVQLLSLIVVAALQRKAVIIDSLDSNIMVLTEIKNDLEYLLDDFGQLSRREIKSIAVKVHFDTVQLLTRARGWLELSRKIQEIRESMDK